jgi:GH18 family chitinase
MAVPAGLEYIEKGYDIPKLNQHLDWFNLLTYDYHSAFEPSVNHHAPLYGENVDDEYNYDSDLNIVSYWVMKFQLSIDPNLKIFIERHNQLLHRIWSRKREIGTWYPYLWTFLHSL